jgi:L-amino acid N-acyltransferase YncA
VDSSSVQVRPATEADLGAILFITNLAINRGHSHFATGDWTRAEVEADFAERTARHLWLVAEQAGEVVGYCKTSKWNDRGAYAWTVAVGIYVDVRAQGQGVGRALYRVLIPALEQAGVRTVLAGIALPNWASIALHEALGFKQAGLLPRAGYKGGAWRDVGYWALHLGGEGPPEA